MKKIVLLAFILVLMSTALVMRFIRPAVAEGTIYIRAYGSVDPPTVPILSVDNITYTFTGNINDSIVVERDNIVVDGAGYTLQGTGSGYGIELSGRGNVTIKNTQIKSFIVGIYLSGSLNNTISGNNITNNAYGIELYDSSNNNTIGENNITSSVIGIWFDKSSNNNTIRGNNAANNTVGIEFDRSSKNNIIGNNITDNVYGIWLSDSSNNNISGNNVSANNAVGFELWGSLNNTISENNVTANKILGIDLYFSLNNKIYHNNFFNNRIPQVYSYNSTNVWDDGYPSGGNYWSDYNGTDVNQDGIGDTSYEIGADNIDNYPLMGMFSDFHVTLEEQACHVTTICNSTISAFEFDQVNRIIRFNVTGEEGVGFCRVCIPHDLMEPPYTVTVDGHPPQYVNYTLYDNGTHRWIYFTYQHSTHNVEIIPEFPTWMSTLLILMVLTAALVIYRRRLLKTSIY